MALSTAALIHTLLASDCSTASTVTLPPPLVRVGNRITFTSAAQGTFAGVPAALILSSPHNSSEGFFECSFDAAGGRNYEIAVSSDLVIWTLLTNLNGVAGPTSIVDQEAPRHPQRFYQIGLPANPVPGMILVPPGTFAMGSPSSESGRNVDEGPQTLVTLSKGLWMGKYEVTQGDYLAVMGNNPSSCQGDLQRPVERVSWYDAVNFCVRLTEQDRAAGRLPPGYGYRLPTEAEWEYACRAGTTRAFGVGNGSSLSSTQANFNGSYPYGGGASGPYLNLTTAVGSYAPNAWGLHDMHGNVWEWCQDWYADYAGGSVSNPKGPATGSYRVLRGGGWSDVGYGCRSAHRRLKTPDHRNNMFGFRVVLAAGQ
jgi:formylglycine-generating enzyme required for sulfatase activity